MKTLVTGATGFLGSHVARALAGRGEDVRVLVRASSDLRALDGIEAERSTGDLRDRASLDRALEGVRRVYHVAADYRLWARDPREIHESNVTGTQNLLDAARRAGVEKFVYTSTVATIAVPCEGGLPNEETQSSVEEMIGHYKRSKFEAEKCALRAAGSGFPVVIVNPTTPVGPGDWKPTPTGKIIVDFLNGRMPGYVDTGLNFVPVENCARGHLLAAERGRIGERYILGGRNLTLKQMLDILSSTSGRPAPRWKIPHVLAYAWIRRFRPCSAANRRFRSKACAWPGTRCSWTRRKPNGSWALRPGRLKPRWSVRLHGTNRTVISPQGAHPQLRARVRLR
jgi:dihydroflavonol-4-reductase